jgi:hypothetical protein
VQLYPTFYFNVTYIQLGRLVFFNCSHPDVFSLIYLKYTVAISNIATDFLPEHIKLRTAVSITVQLHLSRLIGTASYPDMQKIRIIGFFFENLLHWQF